MLRRAEDAMNAENHETELCRRAAAGDRVALTLLLRASRRRLMEYLARRVPADLRGGLDAEDIIQETQVAVFRHIDEFQLHGKDAFFRWLATIAIRRLRDAVKRQRTAKRGAGRLRDNQLIPDLEGSVLALLDLVAASGKTPSRAAALQEAVQAALTEVERLPTDQREAVRLVYLQKMPVAAAAAALGCTEAAIYGLCRRGLETLQERLGRASKFLSSSG